MQFPAKKWLLPPEPEAGGKAFGRGAGLLDRVLARRGVRDAEARRAFLEPKIAHVQPPWSLHGIDDAVRAILGAVAAGRRIAIYGDYDVDGVMATAILWHALQAIRPGLPVETYVPHRREEGYGLNAAAVRKLADRGIGLIVTVDCGVSAVDEARLARELGIDLVITDHHNLRSEGEVPEAVAVVHPRVGETRGFGELCGAAVAWKLAWALFYAHAGCSRDGRLPEALRRRLVTLLSLAAVGTVADVMPLVGENRHIVAAGLLCLHTTGMPGLDALLAMTRTDAGHVKAHELDPEKIAFRLAPPINACGRMQHAKEAVELFTTADAARARELVRLIDSLNSERRDESGRIHEAARENWLAAAENARKDGGREPAAIVLRDERWNLGIVGIVCSKLVDEFTRPVILLTRDEKEQRDYFKGSGRSVPGVDMHRALSECSGLLIGYGGHAMAAGVTVHESRVDEFAQAFARAVEAQRAGDDLRPSLEVDCVCGLTELDISVVREIESLQPFGRGNARPAILVEDAVVTQSRVFGKTASHLELTLRQRERFQRVQWWGGARHEKSIEKGARIDAVIEVKLRADRIAEVDATLVDLAFRTQGL